MKVQAVMTSPAVGIEPSAPIADKARLMLSKKISGLPVIRSDGPLVGIVSEGDFLRRGELVRNASAGVGLNFLSVPEKSLMNMFTPTDSGSTR